MARNLKTVNFIHLLALWALFFPPLLQNGLSAAEGDGSSEPFFRNVAAEIGLDKHPAQRVALVDLNGDHYLDCVMGCVWKDKKTYCYLSRPANGDRSSPVFSDFTEESHLALDADHESTRSASVIIFADVDNDGDVDAFSAIDCSAGGQEKNAPPRPVSAIMLNDGEGRFVVAAKSGVGKNPATTCAATFFDGDNDGLIDLFVGNWYRDYGSSLDSFQDRLYKGIGKGRFREITEKSGLETLPAAGRRKSSKPVYGAGHCDYNNDGLQDILVCVYGRQWNFLWENSRKGLFTDVAAATRFDGDAIDHGRYPESIKEYFRTERGIEREDEAPFRSNGNTFSVAPADFDCDGDIDLFVGEITHAWAGESSDRSSLLINQGAEGKFVFQRNPDAIPRKHASPDRWNQGDMHVAWIDFDNDGLQDLLVSSGDYPDGQYLRLFEQQDDHSFRDITAACGFDWESSSGISVGDFDRDGDEDIVAGKSWMRIPADRRAGSYPAPALFRNDVGNKNNWITIQLEGKARKGGANALGIGARIVVEAGGRVQMREIRGGCGHAGQYDPPEAHFGLGAAESIDKITVRWPNKKQTVTTVEGVEPNRLVRITESGALETLLP